MSVEKDSTNVSSEVVHYTGANLKGFTLFAVLGSLLLTLLLEALDQTVVSTALPRIISTLQGFDRYTWAVTAYALASITAIPIVGKLSDQFGRKGFLLVGTLRSWRAHLRIWTSSSFSGLSRVLEPGPGLAWSSR
jgi:MFS family permease